MANADNVIKRNQSDLKDAIVSSGLLDIITECEEKDLITSAAKSQLISTLTNQDDDHRAQCLISNIPYIKRLSAAICCVLQGLNIKTPLHQQHLSERF